MNRLFGGSKPKENPPPPPPPPPKKQLPKVQMNEIQKKNQIKCRQLSQTITQLENEATQMYRKVKEAKGSSKEMYKQRCVQILKKKKLYQQQLKGYMSQQIMIDQVNFTKQNIQNTIEMGAVMKVNLQQQKKLMQNVNIDELQDLQDQMLDMKFETQYMNELMNRNYDVEVDEVDLDAEMEDLDNDFYNEVLKKPNPALKVPTQNNTNINNKQSDYKLKN